MAPAAWAADPQITAFVDTGFDPVPAGGIVQYTVSVNNNQADAALNTRLRVSVAAGASFLSASPPEANCAPVSATTVECNLGTLGGAGPDPRDVVLRWRVTAAGGAILNATAVISADNDVNAGNNAQPQDTTVIAGANLGLAKAGTPNPVVGGALITYTLTGSNAGPDASTGIVVTDNLPPSVSYVSAAGPGWACGHSAGVVTCTRAGPHAAGVAIPAITLVGRVTASGGTVTNSATIAPAAGGVTDPDSSNNTATFDATVLPGADVQIAQKSVTSALPAVAGSNVSFLIQPRNGGPAAATSVTVTDPLPAGWTFVSAGGTGWACSNAANTVSCTRASLSATATDNITVVARAPGNAAVGAGSSYTNTASIGATSADPDSGNNSGSVSVTVLPDGADLRIAKSKTPNPVAQGSNMTSTITVTNNGPRSATGPLRVVELLTGESYVSASGRDWTCDATAAPTIVCTHPNTDGLAVNASLPTLGVITRADVNGSAINTACTGGSVPPGATAGALPPVEGDPNAGNDCATTTSTSTTVQPDLALSKSTSTPAGGDKVVSTSEGTVTYTLVASNVSATPQAATGLRIHDDVPAFIAGRTTFASITATPSGGSTASFSCSSTGSRVDCNQTGGQLTQGQSVAVVIVINRPLREGTYTNAASINNANEGDPNPNNNQATDTVTIEPIADVEMTGKTVTPGSVRAGEVATYVLSYRNNGPSPATGVAVADTFSFPGGDTGVTVTQIDSTAPGSSCNIAAGAVLNPASPGFSCTIGALANGQTESITLRVRPNYQPTNAARSFGNLARVSTTSVENPAGGDNGNNTQSATLTVRPAQVDLLVNKTDRVGAVILDPVPYVAGSTFLGYQISVTNVGPSYASAVRVTEAMTPPAGRRVRFVCDVTSFGGSTCNPTPLCSVAGVTSGSGAALAPFTCNVPAGDAGSGAGAGELAVGATKNIFLRFEALDQPAPRGDVFNDVATVSANEPDSDSRNDSVSESTTVRQRVNLATTKTASVPNPALRQPFNWLIRVTNGGPGNSLQTDLTDSLPAGVEVIGPITWTRTLQPASGTCTLTGSSAVACALGQLDGGGEANVTVPVRIVSYPAGGSLSNSATVDTNPDKTGGIDTPGGNNTGSSTVTVQRSSLAGTVFQDRDRSAGNGGVPQAAGTEPRIAGVTVTLTGTDAYGNTVNLSTVTDGNGQYVFNDLSPAGAAGYTITQTQPAGYVNGPVAPPTSGGNAPSAGGSYSAGGASGNSSFSAVVLAAGVSGTNYNFPEVARPGLSGFVYVDLNHNGVRDAGSDGPIVGATVRLLDAATGAVVATATTGADGSYGFTGLDPLVLYTLEEPLPAVPAGLGNGPVNPGLVNGAACASGCTAQPDTPAAGTDRIAAIDLSAGTSGTAFNFGEQPLTSISGTVFVDLDNNGLQNLPGDAGLGGVTLVLTGVDNLGAAVNLQVTTAANGSYSITGLRPGTYTLTEPVQPGGTRNGITSAGSAGGTATAVGTTPSAISGIVLGVGASSINNNFGEVPAGRISGQVFADNNDNGQPDSGETGLGGVLITLTGSDDLGNPVTLSTTTAADGSYSFGNLRPGSYTLTEPTQPAGTVNGQTLAGSLGGTASTPGQTPSTIRAIVLPPGGNATGNNFAELGLSPDLRVSKSLVGTRFTVGLPARYLISVRNAGDLATSGSYTVSDRLPAGLTLAATPTGTGWACVGAAGAASFSCSSNTVLAAGAAHAGVITADVGVGAAAAAASPVNNAVLVEGGGEIAARGPSAAERDAFNGNVAALLACTAAIEHNTCRTPTVVQLAASISGTVWNDSGNAPKLLDGGDRRLPGWLVEVIDPATGAVVGRATTGADGSYRVDTLQPGIPLAVRFRDPASNVVFGYPVNGETAAGSSGAVCDANAAASGGASSCVGSGANPALTVVLKAGENLPQQSLPVDPSGVVYDSGLRQPVPGAVVTLAPSGVCAGWNPPTSLVGGSLGGYTVNGSAVSMTVGSDGFYQFLFAPAAPANCSFGLTVSAPSGYTFQSTAIPPAAGPLVPTGGPTSTFPVQPQAAAPTGPVGGATTYYLSFSGGSAGANVIHNHIPLDPVLPGALALAKTGDKAAAEVGDSVRYAITVSVAAGGLPRQTTVVDRLPAGFTYIKGTAMVGDVAVADPVSTSPGGLGPTLAFNLGAMPATRQLVLHYRVRVGIGAQQGDGINRARGHACGAPAGCVGAGFEPVAGSVASNEAAFRVRVGGGVFTTDACVLGKIFVDCNGNHVQDPEEIGIPGVRLFMQDGTTLISDSEGKYSMCGVAPRSAVLKVDPITLPRGSRLTTSSNRNLGDAGSLWLDIRNGELHRADFVEGSCSKAVLDQVKARRAQGEVRAPDRNQGPALRFDSQRPTPREGASDAPR